MAAAAGISEAKLVAALRKWGGMKSLAARELGISRQAVHARIKGSLALQTVLTEIEEENLDIGEGHLLKALRQGNKDAVRYYLDKKGRKRGYGNSVSLGVEDAQVEAFIEALGGSVEAYRAALRALGLPAAEIS